MQVTRRIILFLVFALGLCSAEVTTVHESSTVTSGPDSSIYGYENKTAVNIINLGDCYEDGQETRKTNCSRDSVSVGNIETPPSCTEQSAIGDGDDNITVDAVPTCRPSPPVSGPIWDRGLLSHAQYVIGETTCRYLYTPLIISAVLLNVFNIIVYTDVSMRSPTSTYLIALSSMELISAFMSIIRTALKYVYGSDAVKVQGYLIFVMYFNNPFKSSIRRLMYCFSVLVSTERFLAVAFPLKARNFRLVKSPIVFVVVVITVVLLCHLPGAFKFNVVPKPNSTEYTIKPTTFYINTGNFLIMLSLVNKIIYTYSLLVVGLTVNCCVLLALKMHSKNRKQMNTSVDEEKRAKRERQTTVAILTSSFLFTFLALPLATDSVISSFLPHYNLFNREHYVNLLMKEVNDVLILFSLSTDYVFYMLLSKAFRRTFFKRIPFVAIFCRRKKEAPIQQSETKISSVSMSVTNEA